MPIKNLFKASLAGAALFALSVTGASAAPDIPCGTAKLIVPWGAGGGTDIIFRQIVDKVNKMNASFSQIRGDLSGKVNDNVEAIESIDAYRVTLNAKIRELELRLSQLSP